ncbi:MAG: uncharacterized protein JWR45_3401 [Blastococcus sp.]|nr:uncharacterized protein [Blastococcus sp.]
MTGGSGGGYVEHGGTWRPLWIVAAAFAVFLAMDVVLPGPDIAPFVWALLLIAVPGIVAGGCLSARRIWTVRVDDQALSVGRERVPLSDIDVGHLRAVDSGVDAGAPVLGGGWSLPRGRTGLPLRFTDGRTVLVPTRDPAALYEALMTGVGETPDGGSGTEGTLAS